MNTTTCWNSPATIELISFMQKDLVLRYKWLPGLKLTDDAKRGAGLAAQRGKSSRWAGRVGARPTQ